MKLSFRERIGKWMFPELFKSREELLYNSRAIAEKYGSACKDVREVRARAHSAEDTIRLMKHLTEKTIVKHDQKHGTMLRLSR